jgi:hypothetical protein
LQSEGRHDKRCPNYIPQTKTSCVCSICGESIESGEEYCINDDFCYAHYDCLLLLSGKEMLEWAGCEVEIMEDDLYEQK